MAFQLKFLIVPTLLLLTTSLAGCSGSSSNSNAAPEAIAPSTTASPITTETSSHARPAGAIAPSSPVAPIIESNINPSVLSPGDYCYKVTTETLEGTAQLSIDANDGVIGKTNVTIQNPEAGYFSSYQQSLNGTIRGEQLRLRIITQIEGDIQQANENWIVTSTGIETGRESYTQVNCSAIATTPAQPAVITRPSGQIEFASGTDSATIKSSVVRGDRNVYQLRATAGQQMSVRITSLEDNAVFDVLAPGQRSLQQEATTWSSTLPTDGDYIIQVGGTRGNATYELTVQIQ